MQPGYTRIPFNRIWFTADWWQYLFQKPWTWRATFCRMRGHPAGVLWYSGGNEPDMRCKNCADNLA